MKRRDKLKLKVEKQKGLLKGEDHQVREKEDHKDIEMRR
jgi:hypothetical protein